MSTINGQEKKYRITELTWEYHKNAERQAVCKDTYYQVILMKNYMQLIFIIN